MIPRRLAHALAPALLIVGASIAGAEPQPADRASAPKPPAQQAPPQPHVLGPDQLPDRLHGLWKVSLCICTGHAWIRYENVETGEVHSAGRYAKFAGGRIDYLHLQRTWPTAKVSGVHWDMEQKLEEKVRAGKYLLVSVLVKDPPIYRGLGNGFGHGGYQNNCATYARDAWHYYSGEGYALPRIETPEDLLAEVLRRHPDAQQPRTEEPAPVTQAGYSKVGGR